MDYFDEQPKRRRPKFFTYVTIVVVTTALSSATTLALAPRVLKDVAYQNQPASFQATAATPPQTTANAVTQTKSGTLANPFQTVNIAKNVGPAIVGIANFQANNSYGQFGFGGNGSNSGSNLQEVGTGSGIIVDANKGYIVTNNHVIDGASKIVVTLADGRNVTGKLVGADSQTDLAVVQISDTKGLVAAPIGDSTSLQVGDPVVAIGNPGGEEFARSVTEGVVSALNRELDLTGESSFNLIQTDAAINPGNSGGALVNWQGQVVGINSAKYQEQGFEGMGFAIPISDAWPVITQIIQTGHASHAGIFVSIDSRYDDTYAQAQGMAAGALIANVMANGPAAKAGIQAGDIITSVDGNAVKNYYDLNHQLFKHKTGDTVKLGISRNGKSSSVDVTLAELPASTAAGSNTP